MQTSEAGRLDHLQLGNPRASAPIAPKRRRNQPGLAVPRANGSAEIGSLLPRIVRAIRSNVNRRWRLRVARPRRSRPNLRSIRQANAMRRVRLKTKSPTRRPITRMPEPKIHHLVTASFSLVIRQPSFCGLGKRLGRVMAAARGTRGLGIAIALRYCLSVTHHGTSSLARLGGCMGRVMTNRAVTVRERISTRSRTAFSRVRL